MSDEEVAESPAAAKHAAPDEGEAAPPTDAEAPATETSGGRTFSLYGIASAVLGILSVAAIAVGVGMWSAHHKDTDERAYQNQVMLAAASWTSVLVNMNAGNVDASMGRLRGKTAGQLNVEFNSVMEPYRAVIQKIQSKSTGRIESVTIESVYHDLGIPPGAQSAPPALQPPPSDATRTDNVTVVATSVLENPEGKAEAVRWNLQLGVSDVGGALLISGLRSIR